jgi:hypothetical protein
LINRSILYAPLISVRPGEVFVGHVRTGTSDLKVTRVPENSTIVEHAARWCELGVASALLALVTVEVVINRIASAKHKSKYSAQ